LSGTLSVTLRQAVGAEFLPFAEEAEGIFPLILHPERGGGGLAVSTTVFFDTIDILIFGSKTC
jgi:hypothetical protein